MFHAYKRHYPIGTPDVLVSRIVRGPPRPAVLTFVATGQRITEDPLLPFERLLGHPFGIALLMEMTEYPTEEKLSREARSWRGSLHKVSRRSGEAQVKAMLVVWRCLWEAVQSSEGQSRSRFTARIVMVIELRVVVAP